MKLIDMKLPKPKPSDKKNGIEPCYSGDKYPWGLMIDLNGDSLKKLPGVDKADVGEELTISAVARVVEKRSNETQSGNETRMELQIVKLGIEREVDDQKAFDEGADDASD